MSEERDTTVAVIGAGAAGLAAAWCLRRVGIKTVVFEQADSAGGLYPNLYRRFHLLSPRYWNRLPGMVFPSSFDNSMGAYAACLRDYAAQLPVHYGHRVIRMDLTPGSPMVLTIRDAAGEQRWSCRFLVLACGKHRVPHEPPALQGYSGDVYHYGEYRGGGAFVGKNVLILGSGASACELAVDLVRAGAQVSWSRNRQRRSVSLRWLGVNVHYWVRWLELLPKAWYPGICGGRQREPAVYVRSGRWLRRHIRLLPWPLPPQVDPGEFQAVFNCTGFGPQLDFLPEALQHEVLQAGSLINNQSRRFRGVFVLGFTCAGGIDSAFLRGIRRDAERVAGVIKKDCESLEIR